MDKQVEVVGIGSPFVDYIIEVDEKFLKQIPGKKGGMYIVDYPTFLQILEQSGGEAKVFAGGSSANTIRGLANLGHQTALVGRIGRDEAGKKLLQNLSEQNVVSYLHETTTPTAQALCLITPDGERTLRSYLGASQEMVGADIKPSFFEGVKLVHIEGYCLLKETLTHKAMELAKAAKAKISFDLGSFEVVNLHQKTIYKLLSEHVDIVFANRDEIYALTGSDPEKGCRQLSGMCETVVVLLGAEGCLVAQGKNQLHVPAQTVDAIDTTGAGDLFASGFLHGYLKGYPLQDAALFGTFTGAAVVQVSGVVISPQTWLDIRGRISGKKKR